MTYEPTVWEDEPAVTTPVNAANLNKLEEGVEAAHDLVATEASDRATAITSAVDAHVADTTNVHGITNTAVLAATTASFTTADETKLDGIEALADVTDAANVIAAGAGMIRRWDGDSWEARGSVAPFGVLFLSTNDASATAPDDADLLTGDVWDTHPDAV